MLIENRNQKLSVFPLVEVVAILGDKNVLRYILCLGISNTQCNCLYSLLTYLFPLTVSGDADMAE